jgi:hypothetical protein
MHPSVAFGGLAVSDGRYFESEVADMQDFIRRKNIENLTKQLASGRLDEAQRAYAEKRLAEELAQEPRVAVRGPVPDTAPC